MLEFIRDDYECMLQDAGLDAVIESLVNPRISLADLTTAINAVTEWTLTEDIVTQYIAQRWEAGALLTITHRGGGMAGGEVRPAAPTGLGLAEWGVWFGAPDAGTKTVRWYVNGALAIRRSHDLTANRSATLTELGAQAGDIVQVCIEAGGVVGWWGRISV